MAQAAPTFWLIAGPAGVGKTTFAFLRLKAVSCSVRFVNPDEIACGFSPLEPSGPTPVLAVEGRAGTVTFQDEAALASGHPPWRDLAAAQ
jgi:predicted ABC-type ATPase